MIVVQFAQGLVVSFEKSVVEDAARRVIVHESKEEVDLSVMLTEEAGIRELNQRFRSIDASTDVLAFPSEETDPDTGRRYLGDVVVSIDNAQKQARSAGHSLETELQLLTVHGVLHLFGYDHTNEAEKNKMWAVQAEILNSLGLDEVEIYD